MKFVISFFFALNASASPIYVFYEEEIVHAETVKHIFIKEYKIPEFLITLKKTINCAEVKKKGKLDVCLKNNGDLEVVSVDRGFINESLKIFQAP